MKLFVIGGGGREHALCWRLSRDSDHPRMYCAPGNAGTATVATNVPIEAEDVAGLVAWAVENRPDLTIVGPEAPLCAGITDELQARGLRVFGPSRAAARIEGSKAFSKDIMVAAGVPTADARTFTTISDALDWAGRAPLPLVVKADGLAAGKGVIICTTRADAEAAVRLSMEQRAFGDAGRQVVIEEFLEGEEASILALCDGRTVVMLASAQDHKRVFDNDQGPNTGGMGAYSPAPVVTPELLAVIRREVFERTLAELQRRGIEYKGILYAGIMVTRAGPKVLEFNCRFGDPETQAVLPRLASDLRPALEACVDGTLGEHHVRWAPDPCVCVVMASGGYPGSYRKGIAIQGLDDAGRVGGVTVFHAGTASKDGGVVTAGGRVLGVAAHGSDLPEALRRAYDAAGRIRFEGAHYRKDIAARALGRVAG